MKSALIVSYSVTLCALSLLAAGCSHKSKQPAPLQATAAGAAIVESSGGKQIGYIGMPLDQPVVVQVNDASGSAVTGAAVYFHGPSGLTFAPASALTDSSGQVTTNVSLGQQAGRYKIVANTRDASGKNIELPIDEIALGYQQTVGAQLNAQYCIRCHDPESSSLRVSNMDNLSVKPHAFTEGDTLNKMSDPDLVAIISHGGPALNKSAEMPPWGYTLAKSDIAALVSYIRAVADPPYEAGGLVYAQK
jgi:mono/diheme cytochrome c family protein